ncbi:cyclin-domain-containing protein, partial [Rhizoclosmatium globosum]
MIADMLQRLTSHNDQIPLSSSTLTRFHSRAPPNISILDYLRRIVKYASVERVCLLILLVYIDRVCERNRAFTISSLTVHRFIITGVTVACKALCDSFLQNSMYAKVGGISTKELNVLEIEFLTLIGWDLTASAERLQDYYRNLVRQHPGFRMVPHGEIVGRLGQQEHLWLMHKEVGIGQGHPSLLRLLRLRSVSYCCNSSSNNSNSNSS